MSVLANYIKPDRFQECTLHSYLKHVYRMCIKLINKHVSNNNSQQNNASYFSSISQKKKQKLTAYCTVFSTFHFLDFWCAINGCIYLQTLMLFNPSIAFISAVHQILQKSRFCIVFIFHRNEWKIFILHRWAPLDYDFVFTLFWDMHTRLEKVLMHVSLRWWIFAIC